MAASSSATGPSDNTKLRRRRQSGSEDENAAKDRGDLTDSSPRIVATPGDLPRDATIAKWPMLLLILHAAGVGIFVWGWILRIDLHTSVECDMTYSQRQLIPIPLAVENAKYGLYKFIDQRDPRPHHRAMMTRWLNTVRITGEDDHQYLATKAYRKDNEPFLVDDRRYHCTPRSSYNGQNGTTDSTLAVLYIPGHWGSYMQSRSIGAHGIQLTGLQKPQPVLQALTNNLWKGLGESDISQFVFDVYAIDFQEEGAALHAQFLWAQTTFVSNAIQHIVVSNLFT
jgi:PGAP1-like protein